MTADQPRLRVTTNAAFGVCLILLGTTLLLDRMQFLDAQQILFRFWPVAIMLVGAALVIESFQRAGATPAAAEQPLRLGHVIAWTFVALFMWNFVPRFTTSTRGDASDTSSLAAVMSRHQHVSNAAVFRGAEVTAVMGRADLDLRKTSPPPDAEATIEVFALMGGVTIFVPEDWQVDMRATPIMGGARDRRKGSRNTVPGAPRLVIRGLVLWGGLEIRS